MNFERERDNQGWIYDLVVKSTGRTHNFAYDSRELPVEVKSYAMIPRVLERQARRVEVLARAAEERGNLLTAASIYAQALRPYLLAQHAIYEDDNSEKIYLHGKLLETFASVVRCANLDVETVEVPFEDTTIQAYFHRSRMPGPRPTVLYVPGMDQTKERFPNPLSNPFAARGMHVLSIDGPGQGTSNIRKLRLTLDNYERAGQAAISWLVERDEVDADKIGVFGCSMGSHWATQIGGSDPRVRVLASAFACYTNKRQIFEIDSPRFKRIFMYMTGIADEEEFDKFAQSYVLDPYFETMDCTTLMVHGEFDPLSDLDEALKLYDRIKSAKEFWIMEDDFHMPIGTENLAGLEIYPFIADWMAESFDKPRISSSKEVLIHRSTGIGPFGPQMLGHRLPERVSEDSAAQSIMWH
jgi:pimeloyl-ACP methyl ester carboxylesterase